MTTSGTAINKTLVDKLTWFSETYHSYVEHIQALNRCERAIEKYKEDANTAFYSKDYFSSSDEDDEEISLLRATIRDVSECETTYNSSIIEFDWTWGENWELRDKKVDEVKSRLDKARHEAEEERHRLLEELDKSKASLKQVFNANRINRVLNILIAGLSFMLVLTILVGPPSLAPQYLIPLVLLLIIKLIRTQKNKKMLEDEYSEKLLASKQAYEKKQREIEKEGNEIVQQAQKDFEDLQKLTDEVAAVRPLGEAARKQGIERAGLLLDKWRAEHAEIALNELSEIESLYEVLVESEIIPDKDDWCFIDEILRIVRSGRALDLTSALNLLDTKLYRQQDISLSKSQIAEMRIQTTTIKNLAEARMRQQEKHHMEEMAQREGHHEDVMEVWDKQMEQRERHRAAQAAESARQAELAAANMALQAQNLRVNREIAAEAQRFHDEVRERWGD